MKLASSFTQVYFIYRILRIKAVTASVRNAIVAGFGIGAGISIDDRRTAPVRIYPVLCFLLSSRLQLAFLPLHACSGTWLQEHWLSPVS
ncbi:MAG: hypothetical protein C4541_06850 [Candidatus Auribacter fodinae]|uniref:Uncharacterized protein n=1 Tax=Candidatus Auribacter fodinae TaxID=2093366 RepID=A0A3A4R3U6_9BACT|nr:MAG: hypothetical protein C4541_06850 [Candidatus Auribacter fodinae]